MVCGCGKSGDTGAANMACRLLTKGNIKHFGALN